MTDTNFDNSRNINKIEMKKINSTFSLDKQNKIRIQKNINTLNMEEEYQSLMTKVPKDQNKTISYIKTQPNIVNKKYENLLNLKKKNIKHKYDILFDENYSDNKKNNATDRIKKIQEKWKEYDQLSPEQRQRREFLESKKKWVCKEDFHRVFGLHTTAIKPIPNVMSYGKPVTDYKFREVNHKKWLTPNGFV